MTLLASPTMKKTFAQHSVTMLRRALGYGILVTLVSLIAIAIYVLNNRADLHLWHEVDLDEEFTTKSEVDDFSGYLALEERLFDQLETEVYAKLPPGDAQTINRYQKGSMMDPTSMQTNWNRTFQLPHETPTAGVLLLHGMSDSPYSLRHLGETYHQQGASVIGLRIPGHGTAPSGLIETTWKDMSAAVRLAATHLQEQVGDQPIYLVGYSNGGALAVMYAIESLEDDSLPRPEAMVLLSPEIGVSKAAALAVWQGRVGHWLGLDKLAWNSISMEYDPFKYGSFAVNAGDQAHRITAEIDKRLGKMSAAGELEDFPRTLVFQSAVDATVSVPALISRLFSRLPPSGHQLVLFDINRVELIEHLLKTDPADQLADLLKGADHPFTLSVISNTTANDGPTSLVQITHRQSGQSTTSIEPTDLSWPDDTFSLSHVALPFPEDDGLYGSGDGGKTPTLGNRALRGERGTLLISPSEMLRQKWNPFYSWLEQKSLSFTGFVPDETGAPAAAPE